METTIDYQQILRSFCDPERPSMCVPFKQGDFYFATDGIVLIQLPVSVGELPFPGHDKVPNALAIMPTELHDPITIDVLKLKNLIDEVVALVPLQIECEICDGAGSLECNLGHEHDCEECNGRGTWDHDTKQVRNPDQVLVIDTVPLRVEVLTKLITTSMSLNAPTIQKVFGKTERICLFEVGQARIILMSAKAVPDEDFEGPKYIQVDITQIQ